MHRNINDMKEENKKINMKLPLTLFVAVELLYLFSVAYHSTNSIYYYLAVNCLFVSLSEISAHKCIFNIQDTNIDRLFIKLPKNIFIRSLFMIFPTLKIYFYIFNTFP